MRFIITRPHAADKNEKPRELGTQEDDISRKCNHSKLCAHYNRALLSKSVPYCWSIACIYYRLGPLYYRTNKYLCHLYETGGVLRELEFVRSSAACFCFLRITSWSFCLTRELATAPVGQGQIGKYSKNKPKYSPHFCVIARRVRHLGIIHLPHMHDWDLGDPDGW